MIIVRIESGLGNQMLDFAEYLAVKKAFPNVSVYADLTIFDINQKVNLPISQWNGYELNSIFGINILTLKDLLGSDYDNLIDRLIESQFWDNDWRYAPIIVGYLNEKGYCIENMCALGTNGPSKVPFSKKVLGLLREKNYYLYRYGYTNICRMIAPYLNRNKLSLYYPGKTDNFYCGQTLNFMMKGYGIEKIKNELMQSFEFPISGLSERNRKFIEKIEKKNCTSIHVRRGDFLVKNDFCYRFGYFSRAVKYIKKRCGCKIFIIFCDNESVSWVKENLSIFGLSSTDHIHFVTWNTGKQSFWDMYLMSKCRNNVVTQSSFGWWATFFNSNKNKITCSPDVRINTTNWF
ncbi:MAG: alpha-1,2-fucosyltransferase [Acholeplasmatales bacterium]|nr:alpha-1,2-fucosyltransferase [Acholeplasmatales bacterium]